MSIELTKLNEVLAAARSYVELAKPDGIVQMDVAYDFAKTLIELTSDASLIKVSEHSCNNYTPKRKSLRDLAKEAMEVQGASNPIAVARSFSRAINQLNDELALAKEPNDSNAIMSHPVFRLWASKIHSMAGLDMDDGKFSRAMDWAESYDSNTGL